MNTLRNKGDTQVRSSSLKKSNLMHDYYAVSSVDGIQYQQQYIKVNHIGLGWNRLGELAIFMYQLLTFQYRYGKQI